MAADSIRPATARQRRLRDRQRRGEVVAPVPVDNDVINVLLDLGWLPEAGAEDRRTIGAAVSAMPATTATVSLIAWKPLRQLPLAAGLQHAPRQVKLSSHLLEHLDCSPVRRIILASDVVVGRRRRNDNNKLRRARGPQRFWSPRPTSGECEFRPLRVCVVDRQKRDVIVADAPFGKRRHFDPSLIAREA